MRLFYSDPSPFARKPIVLLHEAKMPEEVELVAVSGSAIDPGTLPTRYNPLGKIPTLVLDDGTAIYDSDVICRYLAEIHAPWLFSGDPKFKSRVLQSLGNGILDAAILIVYEQRLRPTNVQFMPWIDGQFEKIIRALESLERDAMDFDSALCGAISMGSLTIAIALSYLDFRLTEFDWRQDRPHLKAWEADIARRPSLKATRPSG